MPSQIIAQLGSFYIIQKSEKKDMKETEKVNRNRNLDSMSTHDYPIKHQPTRFRKASYATNP